MLGDESVAAGIACPEIADLVIVDIGGRFGGYHGVRTYRAGGKIAPARIRLRRDGRQDFSNCCHRDLLAFRTGNELTTKV